MIIQSLIDCGGDVQHRDINGWSALHHAASGSTQLWATLTESYLIAPLYYFMYFDKFPMLKTWNQPLSEHEETTYCTKLLD